MDGSGMPFAIALRTAIFTGAIQDSMYFLGDLIRDRSGLEGDGVALVGKAFGGRRPVLE